MEFHKCWRGHTDGSDFRDEFPYGLSLGDSDTKPSLTTPTLITETYEKMFQRLLRIRKYDVRGST